MHGHPGLPGFLKGLLLLALMGFALIFLSGPVLALFSVLFTIFVVVFSLLLPFLVIGLLVWLPIRFLFRGRQEAVRGFYRAGQGWCRASVVPLQSGVHVCRRAYEAGRSAGRKGHDLGRLLGGVIVEAVCGALVGVLMGAIASTQYRPAETPLALGALIGGSLGMVVGVSRLMRKSAVEQQTSESAS